MAKKRKKELKQKISALKAKKKDVKKDTVKNMHLLIYWMVLLVLTLCNFIVSIVLVPFFLVLSSYGLFLVMAAMGLIFGLMFDLLINDIEHLERKHHVFAIFFIPVIAIIDIFIMVGVSKNIALFLNMTVPENPFMNSLVFVVFFLMPYVVNNLRRK